MVTICVKGKEEILYSFACKVQNISGRIKKKLAKLTTLGDWNWVNKETGMAKSLVAVHSL